RRGQQVSLADGQMHVVADAPGPPVGDPAAGDVRASLARDLSRGNLRAPFPVRDRAGDLARQIDLGFAPDAESTRFALDHVPVAVGELAHFEEVRVRGDPQRVDQADGTVVGVAGVAELLRGDGDA